MLILTIKIKTDLIDQTDKIVKVWIEVIESRIRSKKDLYYVIRQCCKLRHDLIIRPILFTRWSCIDKLDFLSCALLKEKSKRIDNYIIGF